MLPRFTQHILENLCPSDDALGKEPKVWLPMDLGSGSDSVARSLRDTGHAPPPLGACFLTVCGRVSPDEFYVFHCL